MPYSMKKNALILSLIEPFDATPHYLKRCEKLPLSANYQNDFLFFFSELSHLANILHLAFSSLFCMWGQPLRNVLVLVHNLFESYI